MTMTREKLLSRLAVDHVDPDGVARLANGKRLDKRMSRCVGELAPHLLADPEYAPEAIKRALRVLSTDADGCHRVKGGRPLEQEVKSIVNGILPHGREIPRLATPEGRERLRESGVPLDEWVDRSSESWQAHRAAEDRSQRRFERGLLAVGVAALLGLLLWTVYDQPTPPSEGLPNCAGAARLPCLVPGGELVRYVVPATGEVGEISTADFDAPDDQGFDDGVPDRP